MISLVLPLLVLAADPPRYLGGAAPHPLSAVGPVNTQPAESACSVETLRRSARCLFDGRAHGLVGGEAQASQATNNEALARSLGEALCQERSGHVADRLGACLRRVDHAATLCRLGGQEALLDEARRFSTQAQACYLALSQALQLAEVPAQPAPAVPVGEGTSRLPTEGRAQ